MAANISACFTVSIPRSASRSRSSASMSGGYPVCSATISSTLAATASRAGAGTVAAASPGGGEGALAGTATGGGATVAGRSATAVRVPTATVWTGAPISFTRSVRRSTSSSGAGYPVTRASQEAHAVGSAIRCWKPRSPGSRRAPSGGGVHRRRLMLIWEPKPAARRSAYRTGYEPPRERFSVPSSGSTSR